jgi:integrase/recombinase XerD
MSTTFPPKRAGHVQCGPVTAWSIFDGHGRRKYLTSNERMSFVKTSIAVGGPTGSFCLTLAITGARVSEVLALTPARIDAANGAIVFQTLKRRAQGIFRAVPVPQSLVDTLSAIHDLDNEVGEDQRLWNWGRTTAWKRVKEIMKIAQITESLSMPRALRHAFGVAAVQDRIPLTLVKKWLGHAKIETTAIYAEPIGNEERALARLTWSEFDALLAKTPKNYGFERKSVGRAALVGLPGGGRRYE